MADKVVSVHARLASKYFMNGLSWSIPMFISVSNPVQFSISMQLSVACHKFCCLFQADFVVCFCIRPKLENTRSIAAELDGR